jgi:predicted dehydrogenase
VVPHLTPIRVALIGCGDIAGQYLAELARHPGVFQVAACADLDLARARARAAEFGIAGAVTPAEALADPRIELCVNLTPPLAHAAVSLDVLRAGKHVYSEKPLASTPADGSAVLAEAQRRGLRVGCAPDSFLSAPVQQARRALEDGRIGRSVAAFAAFAARSVETWHPNPAFFFAPGGGPVLDMGPYYLTALVTLLGPVAWVSAQGDTLVPERTSRHGGRLIATTPTHVSGTVTFASGALATVVFSFDVHVSHLPRIEVYGTDGSLRLPDPNHYGGAVELAPAGGEWRELPAAAGGEIRRGHGVVDLALALREARPHRASGALALHVLDVMEGLLASARAGGERVATSMSEPLELAA